MSRFESGHPDKITRIKCGIDKNKIGALGALENLEIVFSGEILNQSEKMIKAISIKNFNGDISKRWYVEYYNLNTDSGKWERVREYKGINHVKDPAKRQELIQELFNEIMTGVVARVTNLRKGESEIYNYIKAYLSDKNNSLRKTSIKNMTLALKYFYSFLKHNNYHLLPIHAIKKKHIHDFRIALAEMTSNRSVNGHLAFVKSFFNYFKDNYDDVIIKNPCDGFKKLPTASETHVAYSDQQVNKYFDYLRENDPGLLLFCQFVGLAFVRCEEARHIKVGDIDFKRKTITLWAGYSKTRKRIVKPLMDAFVNILIEKKIYNYPADNYVFSYGDHPGQKQVHYNHFRKRFKKLKTKFNLDKNYTIYSFRHTFISQLIDNGAKWHKVMQYSGHTTMESFANYARSLHMKPTEDLSCFLSQKVKV